MAIFNVEGKLLLLIDEADNDPPSPDIIDSPEVNAISNAKILHVDGSLGLPLLELPLAAPVAYAF